MMTTVTGRQLKQGLQAGRLQTAATDGRNGQAASSWQAPPCQQTTGAKQGRASNPGPPRPPPRLARPAPSAIQVDVWLRPSASRTHPITDRSGRREACLPAGRGAGLATLAGRWFGDVAPRGRRRCEAAAAAATSHPAGERGRRRACGRRA